MKHLILSILVLTSFSGFSQLVDAINYSGALNANGWTTHSGAVPGQIVTLGTPSDLGNSLNYSNLPTPVGNRTSIINGNTEDINLATSGISGTGYYSLLIKVNNTTGLNATGDHFFGFTTQAGSPAGFFGARLHIKTGSVAGTYQLAILNTGATGATPYATDLTPGVTYMVVVKFNATASPTVAEMYVNPVLGSAEPAMYHAVSNTTATAFAAFAGVYIRQGTNTGNIEIDEIRVGSTWASVTPVGGCNTTSTISPSVCASYTVPSGDETYTSSGTYMDTIPNAAMCDSVITINLTVTGPSTSTISPSACTSYTVPSGDETYFASGTYMDTIPNYLGCDSIITINLTIVTSITYYADVDGDGLGDASSTTTACSPPVGYVLNDDDCNDNNNMIGAATTWYHDMDNDGYGSPSMSTVACTAPPMYVANNTDCNDANSNMHPGATEIPNNGVDEDCNGSDLIIAPTALAQYVFTGNACGTPFLSVTSQPANATFSDYSAVGSSLVCATGMDYINYSGWNLSSVIDPTQYYSFSITPASCYGMNLSELHFTHRISGSGGMPTVHIRSSLDGFAADVAAITIPAPATIYNEVIALPSQFATVYDAIEFRFFITSMGATGATYRHDNVTVYGTTNSLPVATYYADADGDTYGDPSISITNCVPPVGYVADATDCNDANANEYPGAMWAIDNDGDGYAGSTTIMSCIQPVGYISNTAAVDCDDNDDNVFGQTTYYADTDGDTYGDLGNTIDACNQPIGYVTNNTDCDDTDNMVGAASIQYFVDADGDGYGDPNNFIFGCSIQVGYATNFDDCDDNTPSVSPDAPEVCDGLDNNCDNNIDEGLTAFTWYADTDNDNLGDPNATVMDCAQPNGYVGNDDDCDDTDPTPNAGETIFYMDADNDGYGDDFNSISLCSAIAGYVDTPGDCNDNNDAINPDAVDVFGNSIDENCDGVDGYLSIEEAVLYNLVAYPNPGNEIVTLVVSQDFEVKTVELISVDGKIVSTNFSSTTEGLVVNTQALQVGVYMIRVSNGSLVKTVRWVKQ